MRSRKKYSVLYTLHTLLMALFFHFKPTVHPCIGHITFYIFHDSTNTKLLVSTTYLLLYQKEYDFQTLKALNFKVYYPVGFLTLNRERYYCAQDDDKNCHCFKYKSIFLRLWSLAQFSKNISNLFLVFGCRYLKPV